jgi:hypothetical protein
VKHAIIAFLAVILLSTLALPAGAIDDARAAAAGVRKISGKRLTLYTDVHGPEIDQLPEVFDQAFPQWCRYFGVKETTQADWHVTGCLMKERTRFAAAGLLPDDLPPFKHGYSTGYRLWLNEQPTDFYRRELLLHEGTHAFMFTILDGAGAPWYKEGMAEYLGTHRWQDGRLKLGYSPRSREESLGWRRVPMIQELVVDHRDLRWNQIMEMPDTAHRQTEPYAWEWAAVTLLDQHPRYQKRFRLAVRFVRRDDFNQRFYRLFQRDWENICEEWQVMVAGIEYGYDVARAAIDFTPGKPLPADGATATVAADHGWQNSGLRLEAGAKYRLTAEGRYQVARTPVIWWCEPNGVSIRYYRGRPLGMLLAAVRPDSGIFGQPSRPGQPAEEKPSAFLHPTPVGLRATLSPDQSGTLFFKINHSAGELDDNAGHLTVKIVPE